MHKSRRVHNSHGSNIFVEENAWYIGTFSALCSPASQWNHLSNWMGAILQKMTIFKVGKYVHMVTTSIWRKMIDILETFPRCPRPCRVHHHNENDSQNLVDEKQDAPLVQKRPDPQKKRIRGELCQRSRLVPVQIKNFLPRKDRNPKKGEINERKASGSIVASSQLAAQLPRAM